VQEIDVVVDEKEFRLSGDLHRRKLREYVAGLKKEPFLGDRIPRRLVPKRFRELLNLFRLELPEGWRALYTVASGPAAGTQIRIVWMGNHTRYERLLGF